MGELPGELAYGVIGVGSIAAAMVVGWCDGVVDAPEVVLSPRNAERSAELAARFDSVRVATDNQAVVDAADVVVVCLLPGNAVEVLSGLRFRPDQASSARSPGSTSRGCARWSRRRARWRAASRCPPWRPARA